MTSQSELILEQNLVNQLASNGYDKVTIKDEKNNNPRLQVNSSDEYIKIMDNLKLANPKMMDIAVPANKKGFFLNEALNTK